MVSVVFIFWPMNQECLWSQSTLLPKELQNSLPRSYSEAASGKAQPAPTGRGEGGGTEGTQAGWAGRASEALGLRKKGEVWGHGSCCRPTGFKLLYDPWIYVLLLWCSSCLQSHFRLELSTCSLETMSVNSPQHLAPGIQRHIRDVLELEALILM